MDDLTLLDVAVMLNHNEVALLLLKFGAQENPRCKKMCYGIRVLRTGFTTGYDKSETTYYKQPQLKL